MNVWKLGVRTFWSSAICAGGRTNTVEPSRPQLYVWHLPGYLPSNCLFDNTHLHPLLRALLHFNQLVVGRRAWLISAIYRCLLRLKGLFTHYDQFNEEMQSKCFVFD